MPRMSQSLGVLVLALSAPWAAVIGAAVGGSIGFLGTLLAQAFARRSMIAERSREERKEAYAAFLRSAEDCLHHFERIAEGHVSPAGRDEDIRRANYFYDEEVTPRLRVMEIIGRPPVVGAAKELRQALNEIRKLWTKSETPPDLEEFKAKQRDYRPARDKFIERVKADL
jgi:hypothetical protein